MDSRDPRDDIVDFLKGLFPLKLAESWDNVGVLVDPRLPGEMVPADLPTNVLLTIDMTERVVEEAIEKGCNMIVAYHPSPFTSFKKVSSRNITQKLVLKCIKNNILVYSPHTACDNASGGVNDWLAVSWAFSR
uniref:NIF3-like protein 1 n=1 Tax=Mucochytrium quahogii TaxID=96639 RepID=A0A7S2WS61_9STRA|mmetsp:Transcript_36215/g.57957  ORF Transcript_36215/g.57957 Transcript_36215/m.57957 type:complete len:133 (+) Transcript_36215:491-889(+)